MPEPTPFKTAAARFHQWYVTDVLPLWLKRAWCAERGGFFEALDYSGAPRRDLPKRVRVQARQIYTMSRVSLAGWGAEAAGLADKGFDYFLKTCCPDGGARGCVHILSADGEITDDRRDLYDQAFLLLACGWRWKASGDARALELIDRTLAFIDRELASPHGGFLENDRNAQPRRQNPHMHLFEAFTALYRLTGEARFAQRADAMYALFTERFFDDRHAILREFFDERLRPAEGPQGDVVEPGHMVEWVWLLDAYERARGVDASPYKTRLYEKAIAIGVSPGTPFLVDQMPHDAAPAPGARRLWPQTEHVKSLCALARAGRPGARDSVAAILSACFETYFDQSVAGLWCDQFGADGEPLAKAVPASILYHLIDAVFAVDEVAL